MGTPGRGCRSLGLMVGQPTFWNPPARARGQVLQRGGVRPDGFDFRTLWKAPLSPCGLSEEKPPPLSDPLQSVPSPAAWGCPPPTQTLVEPSWSQAGVPPPGFPCHPTPRHPQNPGFNVYFLIRMPATREPPGGPSAGRGPWKGCVSSLLPSPSPRREKHLPGQVGPPVLPLQVSDRTRVAFFFYLFAYKLHLLALSRLPCLTHPASSPLTPRSQGHIYFRSEKIISPRERKILEKI